MRNILNISTINRAIAIATLGAALVVPSTASAEGTTQAIRVAQATVPAAPAAAPAAPVPSVNETFQNWRVLCMAQASEKQRCAMSQGQVQKSGQRLLAMELGAPSGGAMAGVLVLPFGLALYPGVLLQIDGKPVGQALGFKTCLPVGCVVPLNFDAATLAALGSGAALQVKAKADGGEEAAFSIPLQGFAGALDRLAALSR
jgi:invasion protein IalB